MITGYTTGVFDLFHVGHVNLLRNAKSLCDKLVVGVTADELVLYKGKTCVIPFVDRIEVVRSCRYVDVVVPQYSIDKLEAAKKMNVDRLFVGDDWYGDNRWNEMELKLSEIACEVYYFPYTVSVSSTLINKTLIDIRK